MDALCRLEVKSFFNSRVRSFGGRSGEMRGGLKWKVSKVRSRGTSNSAKDRREFGHQATPSQQRREPRLEANSPWKAMEHTETTFTAINWVKVIKRTVTKKQMPGKKS